MRNLSPLLLYSKSCNSWSSSCYHDNIFVIFMLILERDSEINIATLTGESEAGNGPTSRDSNQGSAAHVGSSLTQTFKCNRTHS